MYKCVSYIRMYIVRFSDQPFIRLKRKGSPLVQVYAGQKSFRLSPKLQAFPEPEVIW